MQTLRSFTMVIALTLVLAACSSGGSGDDASAAERSRGADVSDVTDVEKTEADHDDEAGHDDGADHHDEETIPSDDAARTVEVEMSEFAYEPDVIEVPAGEPIRFVFHNGGQIDHEAMVGDAHMQEEFASSGDHGDDHGGGHHGDVASILVAPGETGELVVTFDEPGTTMLGCHLPGHWAAGMAAEILVT